MRLALVLALLLTSCAGSETAERARWMTQEELHFIMPSLRREEVKLYLAKPGAQWQEEFCVRDGKGRMCEKYYCANVPRFDCWWENDRKPFREKVTMAAALPDGDVALKQLILPGGDDVGQLESKCLRNATRDDRAACVGAYVQLILKDRERAEKLLRTACDYRRNACRLNGKALGKGKPVGRPTLVLSTRPDKKRRKLTVQYYEVE